MSLLDARERYFEANDFGPDGGYSEKWVKFKVGRVPLAFPNHPSRVRAVRIHDLHHILTGYDTNLGGETEISAFEIGAGCADYAAAWVLNLSTLSLGLFTNPRSTFAAFVRGRRSRSLYFESFDDQLLADSVGSVRTRLGLQETDAKPTAGDRIQFAGWLCLSTLLAGIQLAALVAPLAALFWLLT
jgi:hypothetical protein